MTRSILLFEGGEGGHCMAMPFTRLNLSWIVQGEAAGVGQVPAWAR